eukprot:scaffold328290_cov76-Tisochrysis_lutea.AAC.1
MAPHGTFANLSECCALTEEGNRRCDEVQRQAVDHPVPASATEKCSRTRYERAGIARARRTQVPAGSAHESMLSRVAERRSALQIEPKEIVSGSEPNSACSCVSEDRDIRPRP